MPRLHWIAGALFLSAMAAASGRQPLPAGYRFPTDADRTQEWAASRKPTPTPFHARADFDGDGREDDAWILISTQGPGWGLFVYLNSSSDPLALALDRNRGDVRAQAMGVRVVPKGTYRTGCGKGDWRCDQDEPKVLRLKRPAIDYFKFEGTHSYIWWDARTRKLRQTRMSD
jgi:hypothetical protein